MSHYEHEIQLAVNQFLADQITREEFDARCTRAWVQAKGPVPAGQKLVIGILDNAVAVGHREDEAA